MIGEEEVFQHGGELNVPVDLRGYDKGIYFHELKTEGDIITRKVILY